MKRYIGLGGVGRDGSGTLDIPTTEHNECRLFFLADFVTWLHSTLFFNRNMEDLHNECQLIHCISFVGP